MSPPDLVCDVSWNGEKKRRRATRELAPRPDTDASWSSTTPLAASPALDQSVRRIQALARLQENWDSYGALRIHASAVEGTLRLVAIADSYGLPPPHIVPVADGGLQLEWVDDDRSAEVEVRPDGSVEFLLQLGGQASFEGLLDRADDARAILENLRRG